MFSAYIFNPTFSKNAKSLTLIHGAKTILEVYPLNKVIYSNKPMYIRGKIECNAEDTNRNEMYILREAVLSDLYSTNALFTKNCLIVSYEICFFD
ncbi:MAG: hypothetical protein NW226_02415 [Microscillaceae bacterium]|nr:hypothetical protein [Microscillaceae bacterium]